MNCACYIADSNDGSPLRLNPCPEHERWAKAIRNFEREACARIADDCQVAPTGQHYEAGVNDASDSIARDIRARSNQST